MIAFIVTIVILVFVHELGHFSMARWVGARVETFSIGMGPTLWSRRDRHGCDWRLSALPIGGYVSFAEGEGPDRFASKTVAERALVILGGPVANLLFAVLIIWFYAAWQHGWGHVVTSLIPAITSVFGMISMMLGVLGEIFTTGSENLGGVLAIGAAADDAGAAGGMSFLLFLAILSINLGVVNLLPVPILDGGHLVFLTIEAVRGRPLSEKAQGRFNTVGLILLLLLFAFATWNDIRRLID